MIRTLARVKTLYENNLSLFPISDQDHIFVNIAVVYPLFSYLSYTYSVPYISISCY